MMLNFLFVNEKIVVLVIINIVPSEGKCKLRGDQSIKCIF